MVPIPSVFFSNRVEILYESLRDVLFDPDRSTLFTQRLIIVPSPAMKTWLMVRMAQDPQLGVAAGVKVVYLNEALDILRSDFGENPIQGRLPSTLELSFALEELIASKLELPEPLWSPLQSYFASCGKRKKGRRLAALADQLAQLFNLYGVYGGDLPKQWENPPAQDCQVQLWQELYQKYPGWTAFYKVYSDLRVASKSRDCQIHLFALSFIPRQQFRFLSGLAAKAPIHFWIMSPCQLFWSDVCSDKERRRLQTLWEKKKASPEQIEELDSYLRSCNPLLANFGKLGKEMAILIEESESTAGSCFELPESVQAEAVYGEACFDEFILSPSKTPLTLLQAVQADLALLRNPGAADPIKFAAGESSIQVHSASTRLREIEILHDNLLRIIARHSQEGQTVDPSQIIVMAPDILEYEPYISLVFGKEGSPLDYQLMDLPLQSRNVLAQVFVQLITLPDGRWEASSLMALLEQPLFYRRHRFSWEDVEQIRAWVQSMRVRWGENADHRKAVFERDHGIEGQADQSIGTWEHGWERLLQTLASGGEPGDDGVEVDYVKSELLGRFIALTRSLRSDLKILEGMEAMTLGQWGSYLECLAEAYIDPHANEEGFAALLQQFQAIKEASNDLPEAVFTFPSIRLRLLKAMSRKDYSYRENHLHAVKFCSMLPMRAIPAQVVAILGMHEGAYPRRDAPLSMNLLQGSREADYCPSQTDYDRYLFLEALLSARNAFLLSYCDYSPKDPKPLPPSIIAAEFIQYLDQGYRIGDELPSKACVKKHPFHAFDASYFTKGAELNSFSEEAYQAACALYRVKKEGKRSFIDEFPPPSMETVQPRKLISLEDLGKVLAHPLRCYCQKSLGIYIDKKDKREVDDADVFEMMPWDKDSLVLEAVARPSDELYRSAEKKGILPIHPFKDYALGAIKAKADEIKARLDEGPLYSVEFNPQCTKKILTETGDWILPPLAIPMDGGELVFLTGKIPCVSAKGMVHHGNRDMQDLVKLFPAYLALRAAGITENVFFTGLDKIQKKPLNVDPLAQLRILVAYYEECHHHPSPLVKKLIDPILGKNAKKLEEEIVKSIKGKFSYPDEYLSWAFRSGKLPDAQKLIEEWSDKARSLYGPLIEGKW